MLFRKKENSLEKKLHWTIFFQASYNFYLSRDLMWPREQKDMCLQV